MSKKNKKQQIRKAPATQSSLSFSLSKWFKKILTTHPSTLIITVIFIVYALFLLGGGLFTITSENILPSWYNPNSGRFYFLYPDISNQFVADTVVSMMLYLMGFVGLLSVYQSTKSANKPRQAYMLMIVGVSLVLLSYIFLEGAINFKANGNL
ncbi:MAG: hypothetical protein ACQCN3_10895 [Candidatus Bathyarchaeia archaeon]|jgi:hypothetical protein